MVEHRGIGLSRRDTAGGADLQAGDVTTTAARTTTWPPGGRTRTACGAPSCAAPAAPTSPRCSGPGIPTEVAAMVLDSPCLDRGDVAEVLAAPACPLLGGPVGRPGGAAVRGARARARRRGCRPAGADRGRPARRGVRRQFPSSSLLAARRRDRRPRRKADRGRISRAEVAGAGRPMVWWTSFARSARSRWAFTAAPDGGVLDPQRIFARAPAVTGDQPGPAVRPGRRAAALHLAGRRRLRKRDTAHPAPSVATRIAGLAPDGVLVRLAGLGHNALDTHRSPR
ncbi:hypothetical protein HBB16_15175 [Pseudonocardia sp. MCCB 268]|nr:hypothetical protein [Pseudonocardia cytotoxica]